MLSLSIWSGIKVLKTWARRRQWKRKCELLPLESCWLTSIRNGLFADRRRFLCPPWNYICAYTSSAHWPLPWVKHLFRKHLVNCAPFSVAWVLLSQRSAQWAVSAEVLWLRETVLQGWMDGSLRSPSCSPQHPLSFFPPSIHLRSIAYQRSLGCGSGKSGACLERALGVKGSSGALCNKAYGLITAAEGGTGPSSCAVGVTTRSCHEASDEISLVGKTQATSTIQSKKRNRRDFIPEPGPPSDALWWRYC